MSVPASLPRYTYVGADPTLFYDPTGAVILGVLSAQAADDETEAEQGVVDNMAMEEADDDLAEIAGEQNSEEFAEDTQDAIGDNGGLGPIADVSPEFHDEIHEVLSDAIDSESEGEGAPSAYNGGYDEWQDFFEANDGAFDRLNAVVQFVNQSLGL